MTAIERAGTLGRVSLRMARSLESTDVLREITRGLVSDLEAAIARIWLLRPEDPGHLQLVASAGLSEKTDGSRSRVPIGSLKIGEIAQSRAPVCTTELLTDARFSDKEWIRENALRTFAGYPLEYGDELLGVLAIFARRALTDVELEQLGVFAAQAAIAIKNARLFAEVATLTRRLEAENAYLKEELDEALGSRNGILGKSSAITRVGPLVKVRQSSSACSRSTRSSGSEEVSRSLSTCASSRRRIAISRARFAPIDFAPTSFFDSTCFRS